MMMTDPPQELNNRSRLQVTASGLLDQPGQYLQAMINENQQRILLEQQQQQGTATGEEGGGGGGGRGAQQRVNQDSGLLNPTDTTSAAAQPPPARASSNIASIKFPVRLHRMLHDAETIGFEYIVSWVPGLNNCFKVHDVKQFVSIIMPFYFPRQSHYKSFLRQVNVT